MPNSNVWQKTHSQWLTENTLTIVILFKDSQKGDLSKNPRMLITLIMLVVHNAGYRITMLTYSQKSV